VGGPEEPGRPTITTLSRGRSPGREEGAGRIPGAGSDGKRERPRPEPMAEEGKRGDRGATRRTPGREGGAKGDFLVRPVHAATVKRGKGRSAVAFPRNRVGAGTPGAGRDRP